MMLFTCIGIFFLTFLSMIDGQLGEQNGTETCTMPTGVRGFCVAWLDCTAYSSYIEEGKNDTTKADFLRQRICKVQGSQVFLCCPEASQPVPSIQTSQLIPTEDQCGIPSRVLGNKPGAWPWLALLFYLKEDKDIEIRCHATLITSRHVVTVAHCLNPPQQPPFLVRLGEHHLDHNLGGEQPTDYGISNLVSHPQYSTREGNDIGIVTLDREVIFTESVRPVCLPFIYRNDELEGRKMILVGYGSTHPTQNRPSPLPVAAETPVVSFSECIQKWPNFEFDNVDQRIVCSGNDKVGSCAGDSGIGLTIYNPMKNRFYVVGIVSIGPIICAQAQVPNINTRVSSFLDWIMDIIV